MTIDFNCNSFLDFLIGTIFRILRNILNRPQVLEQFKQLPRWEFSNLDFAGYVHYYNIQ